jgi:hypothetical protein
VDKAKRVPTFIALMGNGHEVAPPTKKEAAPKGGFHFVAFRFVA